MKLKVKLQTAPVISNWHSTIVCNVLIITICVGYLYYIVSRLKCALLISIMTAQEKKSALLEDL